MTSIGYDQGALYSKLLRINSAKAYTNGKDGFSLTNCIVDLGQNCQRVKRVSFTSIVFSNTAYNILDSTYPDPNNEFRLLTGTGTYSFSVPKGFYNSSQLLAAMQSTIATALTTAGFGETFTFTQDPINNLVTFTYNKGTFGGNATAQLLANTNNVASTWTFLGYKVPIGQTSLGASVTITASGVPSLSGIRQAYLRSSTLSPANQFDEKGKLSDISVVIPITAPYGFVNVWECKVDKLCEIIYSTPRNFQQIDFALVDEDGSVIDLNGGNIKIELKIYFDKY